MGTVIVFVLGLFLGMYWEQVNDVIKAKLEQSKKAKGGVQRLDD